MKTIKSIFPALLPLLLLLPGRLVVPSEAPTEQSWMMMLEEEKLARDVYTYFHTQWNKEIFANIARSEGHHINEVKSIFDTKGYVLPAAFNEDQPGVFSVAAMQELYDKLTAQGTVSLEEALKVGAWIEEKDIIDLKDMMSEETDAGVRQTLGNLLQASHNHLRAFTRQLGSGYQPQLMAQADFEAIVSQNKGNGKHKTEGCKGDCQGGNCKGGNGKACSH